MMILYSPPFDLLPQRQPLSSCLHIPDFVPEPDLSTQSLCFTRKLLPYSVPFSPCHTLKSQQGIVNHHKDAHTICFPFICFTQEETKAQRGYAVGPSLPS